MKRYFQSSISAVALSAMVMSGVVATVSITASPAFSKSNNANSNSNGGNSNAGNRNDNSNRGGGGRDNSNGRGSVASSLGALNAAHANANALANAARNSRVGMIDIYKMAVGATANAKDALDLYIEECGESGTNIGDFVEVEIEGGEILLVPYCDKLLEDAATAAGDEVASFDPDSYLAYLEGAFSAARSLEDSALLAAANKSTDDEIIQALWSMLDIDGYELPEVTE